MDNFRKRTLAEVPVVVLDTETTGLSAAFGHRIIEIAAIRLEGWREVDRINQLVNPNRPIDSSASRVNGLYDEDVADAPPFSHIARRLLELMDGALIVAHNAQFDAAFVGMEYAILNSKRERHQMPTNPWLCTYQLARRCFYFKRNSLSSVAHHLDVPTNGAHRALNDVFTTLEILKRMTRRLRQQRLFTVGDYFSAQGGPIHISLKQYSFLPPVLAEALSQRQLLRIRYRSKGQETERVIKPLYPTRRDGNVYVVAYCQLRHSQRTFRVDRILSAELLEYDV